MTSGINSAPLDFIVINALTGKRICENESCKISNDFRAKAIEFAFENISKFFVNSFPELREKLKGKKFEISIHNTKGNASFNVTNSTGNRRCYNFNDEYIQPVFAAHEYAHAIVHSFVDLMQKGESGALNESLADVLAIAYQQWSFMNFNDWKLGNIRDLSEFKHLRDKLDVNDKIDFGHIHENSKIPSHAFYLAATAAKINSSEAIIHIWFEAIKFLQPDENFVTFSAKTVRIAESKSKILAASVTKAWVAVGVLASLPKKHRSSKSDSKPRTFRSMLEPKAQSVQVYPASPTAGKEKNPPKKSKKRESTNPHDRIERENLLSISFNSSIEDEAAASCFCPCTIM